MTLSHYVIHYRPNKNATFYFSKVFGVAILLISLASRRGLIVKTYSVSQDSPRGQKIESWLHLLREMFVRLEYVSFDEPTDCALTARIEHRTLSDLDVRLVASTRQSLQRVPQRASDHEGAHFLVVMQMLGSGTVTQDDRQAVLRPGDFTMYDTTRPYTLDFGAEFEQLVVSVPRDQLRVQVPGAESLTARHISGDKATGRLLRDMVRSLPSAIDESTKDAHPYVAEAVVDLIATNLRALQPIAVPSSSRLQRYQEERIKAFIKRYATDPELTVSKVAQALDMSVSAVYRAFETQHVSVAEMIWLERLSAARAALKNHAFASRSIKEIAFDSGFSDAAHFSRTFRQRFGISPREFRARDS